MTAWLQGKIVANNQWSTDLFSLKISTSSFNFKAGQFIKVGMDINDKVLSRPYSLVNPPQEPLLEIHFNAVENGQLTPLLSNLCVGDNIKVSERANGLLTMSEVPEVPYLWLFATGTGIGPFISILKTAEPWQRFKKIVLCYSVKTFEKLAYHTEFESLQAQHPTQFCFIPIITREHAADIPHSRITTSIENGELEKHAGLKLSADSSHVMLCGNTKMVSEVMTLLEKRGLHRHTRREPGQIATEKYY